MGRSIPKVRERSLADPECMMPGVGFDPGVPVGVRGSETGLTGEHADLGLRVRLPGPGTMGYTQHTPERRFPRGCRSHVPRFDGVGLVLLNWWLWAHR